MTTALTLANTRAMANSLAVRDPWALVARGPLGNLDAYISATHQIPMLTHEEEVELGQYLGYGLPHADLIQEGNIGLMKAVKRFDSSRGVRLVSFALHWIKAEIHEYIIRNWRMVKMITTKAHRKLFFNLNSFKKYGQTLSPDQINEVASELNVRPEDVYDMERRMAGHEFSLDPVVDADSEENSYNPVRYLAAEGAEPTEVLEGANMERLHSEGLDLALASLDERSQRIISSRWLAGNNAKTLHDLAAELGVSAERVRQIETQAMKKMKTALLKYEHGEV
jgi:RNA polymerase sigma-32 factor